MCLKVLYSQTHRLRCRRWGLYHSILSLQSTCSCVLLKILDEGLYVYLLEQSVFSFLFLLLHLVTPGSCLFYWDMAVKLLGVIYINLSGSFKRFSVILEDLLISSFQHLRLNGTYTSHHISYMLDPLIVNIINPADKSAVHNTLSPLIYKPCRHQDSQLCPSVREQDEAHCLPGHRRPRLCQEHQDWPAGVRLLWWEM